MLRVRLRFPLGVYYALSPAAFGRVEWPPSPVRLIGALLAAAHEADGVDLAASRDLLDRLSGAGPPTIIAPRSAVFDDDVDGRNTVAEIRGPARWAPRNHGASEIKKSGLSPRNLARERTEVHKGGVIIGDQPVEIYWPALELTPVEMDTFRCLLAEVTFLGTSRSPVVAELLTSDPPDDEPQRTWEPAAGAFDGTAVRVPDGGLLQAFDTRHAARRTTGRAPIERADHVPTLALGRLVPYVRRDRREAAETAQPFDPCHWGDMLVLQVDDANSELRVNASATYLVARAFRDALLAAYAPAGSPGDAPAVLRGHGDEPHAALVPLPFVGHRMAADGLVRGVAVLLPHESRLADVPEQRVAVEQGLLRLLGSDRSVMAIPGAGRLGLRLPGPGRPLLWTLREARYRAPSRVWETVTPVVHARRRTSTGPRGLERQIAADCAHVGLPAPSAIEVLSGPPLAGAPARLIPDHAVPEAWRASLRGPRSHLRLTFDRPIAGPVILGRARHFGVGLCLPAATTRQRVS